MVDQERRQLKIFKLFDGGETEEDSVAIRVHVVDDLIGAEREDLMGSWPWQVL